VAFEQSYSERQLACGFQQAIDSDPNFSGSYLGLAIAQGQAVDFQTRDTLETLGSVEMLARRAVALDAANAEARSYLGWALQRRGDYEGGLSEVKCALALSPNLATAHAMLGSGLVFSGHPKEGNRGSGEKH
jgi:adenylate cyclase